MLNLTGGKKLGKYHNPFSNRGGIKSYEQKVERQYNHVDKPVHHFCGISFNKNNFHTTGTYETHKVGVIDDLCGN